MTTIEVSIIRWVDNQNPGWVECEFINAFGQVYHFIDKLPIFSADSSLDSTSQYPQPGFLACKVLVEKVDSIGRKISLIDTIMPWGVESVEGVSQFYVLAEQISIV